MTFRAAIILAILYVRMGEIEKAIERWRVCIQAGTEDVVIYRNLSGAYENIGAYDKSIEIQEAYIKEFRRQRRDASRPGFH